MRIIIVLLLSLNINSFGQELVEERIIENPGKKLGMIGKYGIESAVRGTGITPGLIPALGFANIKDDGFLIRKKYKFTKYSESLNKQWEAEIKNAYGLQSLPSCKTIGNKNGIYFIEISNHPAKFNQLHITRFDSSGQMVKTRFTTKDKYDGSAGDFVTEEGCHMLLYKFNKMEKDVSYTLVSFSSKDLSFKEKAVLLDSSPDEFEQSIKYVARVVFSDKLILSKFSFEEITNSKKKAWALKTIEMNFNGDIANNKIYPFQPTMADSWYAYPDIKMDTIHNELYIFGMIMDERSIYFINGCYVKKFNYASGNMIYNKEIDYRKFNKEYSPDTTKESLVLFKKSNVFSNTYFSDAAFDIEMSNQVLRLMLYKYSTGMYLDRVGMTGIRLDKNGDIIQVEVLAYKNNIERYDDYWLIPEKITTIYTAPDFSMLKKTPLDFVHSLSTKMDPEFVLCSIFKKKDFDLVVCIRERDGEIKAFKLAR
jgi:hypothetical protein